jgi:hypothetical protein
MQKIWNLNPSFHPKNQIKIDQRPETPKQLERNREGTLQDIDKRMIFWTG